MFIKQISQPTLVVTLVATKRNRARHRRCTTFRRILGKARVHFETSALRYRGASKEWEFWLWFWPRRGVSLLDKNEI